MRFEAGVCVATGCRAAAGDCRRPGRRPPEVCAAAAPRSELRGGCMTRKLGQSVLPPGSAGRNRPPAIHHPRRHARERHRPAGAAPTARRTPPAPLFGLSSYFNPSIRGNPYPRSSRRSPMPARSRARQPSRARRARPPLPTPHTPHPLPCLIQLGVALPDDGVLNRLQQLHCREVRKKEDARVRAPRRCLLHRARRPHHC